MELVSCNKLTELVETSPKKKSSNKLTELVSLTDELSVEETSSTKRLFPSIVFKKCFLQNSIKKYIIKQKNS